jgi:hypothetical protein
MGHYIRGFIARHADLQRAVTNLPGAKIVPLRLDFGFIPVTESLASDDDPAPFEYLTQLTDKLALWAQEQSHHCPLAYVETDYFGGVGSQGAIVWEKGTIVFGPCCMPESGQVGRPGATSREKRAINQALRFLGIRHGLDIESWLQQL